MANRKNLQYKRSRKKCFKKMRKVIKPRLQNSRENFGALNTKGDIEKDADFATRGVYVLDTPPPPKSPQNYLKTSSTFNNESPQWKVRRGRNDVSYSQKEPMTNSSQQLDSLMESPSKKIIAENYQLKEELPDLIVETEDTKNENCIVGGANFFLALSLALSDHIVTKCTMGAQLKLEYNLHNGITSKLIFTCTSCQDVIPVNSHC